MTGKFIVDFTPPHVVLVVSFPKVLRFLSLEVRLDEVADVNKDDLVSHGKVHEKNFLN